MALINLYTSANAVALEGTDAFGLISTGFYVPAHDAAFFKPFTGVGTYRLYRDGTAVRIRNNLYGAAYGFDVDAALPIYFQPNAYSIASVYVDPISFGPDPSHLSTLTYSGVTIPGNGNHCAVWHNAWYMVSGSTVYKNNMTSGANIATFSVTGALSFSADRLMICPDGTLVLIDFDNATYGVARFYDLYTSQTLYESTFARSSYALVDHINKNIWSIGLSDGKMRTYSFQPAPYAFSPFTLSGNRSRYRQDTVTTTLVGSNGELIKHWPVGWTITQDPSTGEAHMQYDYTETDENGQTSNVFCGPSDAALVGTSMTVEAWTGY
jgi:hypothetical protein